MVRLLEFDRSIVTYSEQPEPLTYHEDGVARKYTPDFLARTDAGYTVFEVKPYEIANSEPWKSRLNHLSKLYREMGFEYRVMTEVEIRREPRLSNVVTLLRYQRQSVPEEASELIVRMLEAGPMTLGSLEERVERHHLDRTSIYSLLARGQLVIDIDQPLGSGSILGSTQGGEL